MKRRRGLVFAASADSDASPWPLALVAGEGASYKALWCHNSKHFEITVSKGQCKKANDVTAKPKVILVRSGFAAHGMSMGQRLIQLNSTSQVAHDGTIALSIS